jgi:hypothetical protein
MEAITICKKCGNETGFGEQFRFYRGPDLGIHKYTTTNGNMTTTETITGKKVDMVTDVFICNRCFAQALISDIKRVMLYAVGFGSCISGLFGIIVILLLRLEYDAIWFNLLIAGIILISVIISLIFFYPIMRLQKKLALEDEIELEKGILENGYKKVEVMQSIGDNLAIKVMNPDLKLEKAKDMGWLIPLNLVRTKNGEYSVVQNIYQSSCKWRYYFLTREEYNKL